MTTEEPPQFVGLSLAHPGLCSAHWRAPFGLPTPILGTSIDPLGIQSHTCRTKPPCPLYRQEYQGPENSEPSLKSQGRVNEVGFSCRFGLLIPQSSGTAPAYPRKNPSVSQACLEGQGTPGFPVWAESERAGRRSEKAQPAATKAFKGLGSLPNRLHTAQRSRGQGSQDRPHPVAKAIHSLPPSQER